MAFFAIYALNAPNDLNETNAPNALNEPNLSCEIYAV